MATTLKVVLRLLVRYVGNNQIDAEGCKHLSQGKYPVLKELNLGYYLRNLEMNQICDKGSKFLS